jgi:tetratricopeptide (TPR) repeat protein
MRRVFLAAVVVSLGCASAPIRRADLAALEAADAQVLAGCYDCLLAAHATYSRVAVDRARPLVIQRLFETDLLLTLREKELALEPSSAWTEAQALAKELPAADQAGRYLAMVEAVPGDDQGWTHAEMNQFRRSHVEFVRTINDELVFLASGVLSQPVRRYLALAIDCAYPHRSRTGLPVGSQPLPPGAPPLLVYRTAICGVISKSSLEQVRKAVPKFVETSYFLGRLALAQAQQNGPGKGRELLGEAYARFPRSPSVTYLTANLNRLVGDCEGALRFYDETIALKSTHEDALLGRTICLTYLKRTDEAIASATHMIALRLDNLDQAYYWRAWNYRFRHQLDLARADIESAKREASSGDILTLAGMIEHDQDDLAPAEYDLNGALNMAGGGANCTAMWYLGLVHMKQDRWLDSAKWFDNAMSCYETQVNLDRASLAKFQARTDLDPDFRNAQIAGFQAAIKEDQSQQYAAAFNAANHYAHGGNVDKAKACLDVAAKDPALADKVAALRKILGGGTERADGPRLHESAIESYRVMSRRGLWRRPRCPCRTSRFHA